MPSSIVLPGHESRLVNNAQDSENSVHSDAGARALGFTWGLVPGVVTYDHLCRPAVQAWGRDWLQRGHVDLELRAPVYDGQYLAVESSPVVVDSRGEVAVLSARVEGDRVVATASVTLSTAPYLPPSRPYEQVPAPRPEHRPPASALAYAALDHLSSVERVVDLDESCNWLAAAGGNAELYRDLGVIAPADLLRDANAVFASNVELDTWMHVATEATHFAPVCDGDFISTRGWVSEVYHRAGNDFAVLDLLTVLNGTEPAVHYRHTVAWGLRRSKGSVRTSP